MRPRIRIQKKTPNAVAVTASSRASSASWAEGSGLRAGVATARRSYQVYPDHDVIPFVVLYLVFQAFPTTAYSLPPRALRVLRQRISRMLTLRDEMDRLFDVFFTGFGGPLWPATRSTAVREFMPSVDVSETDGQVKVSAELPGMTEQDINVEIDEDRVTISGEKKAEDEEEKGGRYWRESSYGRFRRDVPLPAGVDSDNAKASFKNGKLHVTIPKSEQAKQKRKSVEIHSG